MLFEYKKIKTEDLGQGISRKILAFDEKLMSVEVSFEKGAIGEPHLHEEHDQISYVLDGVFEYTIDGETFIGRTGDSFYVKPGSMHGAVCVEAGRLLDIFTPQRKDFL